MNTRGMERPEDSPSDGEAHVAQSKYATVFAVVNARAGSVGPTAAEKLEGILRERCANVTVLSPEPDAMHPAMTEAIAAHPDAVIILGGDGTARHAAELAGPIGPPLILLPGGTMNVLPKALYGARDWSDALIAALDHGVVRDLPGARAGELLFFVAGIFGSPARMAEAREAVREGKMFSAITRFKDAVERAFYTVSRRAAISPPFRAPKRWRSCVRCSPRLKAQTGWRQPSSIPPARCRRSGSASAR